MDRNTFYTNLIMEATSCSKEEASEVEDLMRHAIFMSTLDWQTKEELQEAAKLAYKYMQDQKKGN